MTKEKMQLFGLMVLAVILGLVAGKFAARGIAMTGLVKIAAGDPVSQGRGVGGGNI